MYNNIKFSNTLVNDQCVTEEMKKKLKSFLEKMMLFYDL